MAAMDRIDGVLAYSRSRAVAQSLASPRMQPLAAIICSAAALVLAACKTLAGTALWQLARLCV